VCAIIGGSASGCAVWPRRWGERPCCIEVKPVVRRQPIAWHLFDVTILSQLEQSFHLVRVGRRWLGVPVRSLNLNDTEQATEVGDTAFFTNRNLTRLSPDEVRWGPSRPDDHGSPPFTITQMKAEGKTAGFFVTDARGVRYLFKLDPVDAPELLSGAEVVTSKLFHALGYHVPGYEIQLARLDEFIIAPGVTIQDSGEPRPFTEADLRALVTPRLREGRLRVSASKLLEGDVLGPARFKRFQDCTDMRALRVVCAWVNNVDTKDHNTLLVWDGTRTVGYVIDFGTALGADAGLGGPKPPCSGWTNEVDMTVLALKLATAGWYRPVCDTQRPFSPGIGLLSPRVDPDRWKPYAPNLAFEQMNEDDARWIAGRMAQLSHAHVEAAVSAGQYSRPEDAAYLTDVLEARRQSIVEHYLKGDEGR
jgi:hypothetical protein